MAKRFPFHYHLERSSISHTFRVAGFANFFTIRYNHIKEFKMPNDDEIAKKVDMRPIEEIAEKPCQALFSDFR